VTDNLIQLEEVHNMNRLSIIFIFSFLITLLSQAIQAPQDTHFETVQSLYIDGIDPQEINDYFSGHTWLENKISSEMINLESLYQEKAFTKKLANKSRVKRYQKSYTTWIEEKICPESPYIDRPVRERMTSHYGRRFHPLSGRSHVHAGIDFRGKIGTPVLSSSQGVVKVVSRKGNYGKTIIVDHGNQFTTLYGHLSDYAVTVGEWVNLGQTIGYIGQTGRSTGPHLHFEVRCHNVPLNPTKYLGKMGLSAEVKFKKTMHNIAHRIPAFVQHEPKAPNFTHHDPNYYTRLINEEKLRNLKKSN
jgi:murein DD-endopeptidase MepM/ murein hydrolase activator NlpD